MFAARHTHSAPSWREGHRKIDDGSVTATEVADYQVGELRKPTGVETRGIFGDALLATGVAPGPSPALSTEKVAAQAVNTGRQFPGIDGLTASRQALRPATLQHDWRYGRGTTTDFADTISEEIESPANVEMSSTLPALIESPNDVERISASPAKVTRSVKTGHPLRRSMHKEKFRAEGESCGHRARTHQGPGRSSLQETTINNSALTGSADAAGLSYHTTQHEIFRGAQKPHGSLARASHAGELQKRTRWRCRGTRRIE